MNRRPGRARSLWKARHVPRPACSSAASTCAASTKRAALADANVVALLRRLVAAGEDGRVVAAVPMNMMVFDDRAAMFSLTSQRGELTIFAFSHPDLIQVMKDGFERNWDQGRGLKQVLREIGRTKSGAKLQEVAI